MSRLKVYDLAAAAWRYVNVGADGADGADGASDFGLIQEIAVGAGGVATVDFTSIPGTWRHLKLVGSIRSEKAAADENLRMRFNNDSGSNYRNILHYGNGGGGTGASNNTGTSFNLDYVPAASETSGKYAPLDFTIVDYAGGNLKNFVGQIGLMNSTGFIEQHHGEWASTSAITRVTLLLADGNDVAQGSVVSLYGLN